MKKTRGQFFTVNKKVQSIMLDLLTEQENWKILEPSAGAGDLLKAVEERFPEASIKGWEIDPNVFDHPLIEHGDFFTKAEKEEEEGRKFHSIIGNPPYVAWKNIEPDTKTSAKTVKSRYSDKANLYYLFLDRSIDLLEPGGEIVFIQPKEWLYSTSAEPLRQKLLEAGNITHIIDGGEEKVFPDADVPAIMILRFQKHSEDDSPKEKERSFLQFREGFIKNITEWEKKEIVVWNKYWFITTDEEAEKLVTMSTVGDFFDVKVGIVTGADAVFNVNDHPSLQSFIKEGTVIRYETTKGPQHYIDVNEYEFDEIPEFTRSYLLEHKQQLLSRKIQSFNEDNWWRYGAVRNKSRMESQVERIYTYSKTRSSNPFFISDTTYYGGGLLALFPRVKNLDLEECLHLLNSRQFLESCVSLGLSTGNKVSFQPKTLEAVPFSIKVED